MSARVFVVGVGMTKFEKPGKREWDYPQMAKVAIENAMSDAGIKYEEVEQVYASYCYGDSTCGQRAVYEAGLSGVPIVNVNNNCSSGSSALFLARNAILGKLAECALAVGFEKMERGSLGSKWDDRTNPMERHVNVMMDLAGFEPTAPVAAQLFGNAGREHIKLYGTKPETFAKIAQKNHAHSKNNPYSQFRDVYSLDQVMAAPKVFDPPLTKLQCCPTSDGAAAVVLCSEEFVRRHNLQAQAVEIAGMAMATDTASSFQKSCIDMVGFDMASRAAQKAFQQARIAPKDVQVVELHDCFSANELISYEALGLCPKGGAEKFVESGAATYGGSGPIVNPSGGLISKGHPLGATGLAQCAELTWQLRGMCGVRQVPNCKYALQHNVGLGGACVVSVYRRGFPEVPLPKWPQQGKRNPALEIDPREPTHKKDSIEIAAGAAKL